MFFCFCLLIVASFRSVKDVKVVNIILKEEKNVFKLVKVNIKVNNVKLLYMHTVYHTVYTWCTCTCTLCIPIIVFIHVHVHVHINVHVQYVICTCSVDCCWTHS